MCKKLFVVKAASRFVVDVLVVGEVMRFSWESGLKYENFNTFFPAATFPQCFPRLNLVKCVSPCGFGVVLVGFLSLSRL